MADDAAAAAAAQQAAEQAAADHAAQAQVSSQVSAGFDVLNSTQIEQVIRNSFEVDAAAEGPLFVFLQEALAYSFPVRFN